MKQKPKQKKLAESIAQAAAWTGLSSLEIKAAKARGCPAWRAHRIDCDVLRKWCKANPFDPAEHLSLLDQQKLRKLKAEADRVEFNNGVRRGQLVELESVRLRWTQTIRVARSVLTGKANGLALILSSLTGADSALIEEKVRALHREFLNEMFLRDWTLDSLECPKCQHAIPFYENEKPKN